MSADAGPRADLAGRIDAVEAGYEFLLAYAAQGRTTDRGAGAGRDVREYLEGMAGALEGLGPLVKSCVGDADPDAAQAAGAFLDAVAADARVARAAIRLVLTQPDISSQLIDNLNASIHLRALLTDLFIVDESLKTKPASEAGRKEGE